jgi:proline iminopeptidase
MNTFSAPDGTLLSYLATGDGDPVVFVPGGPMQHARYLGDLGGLPRHRPLVVLELRGTGGSGVPDDPASYRCDRLVGDVEALREHLGLARVDLLSHSAGVNLALLYAARHPGRVGKLALIAPSTMAVGIWASGETRRDLALLREDEPWFPAAFAALQRITAGEGTDDDWEAIAPFR